MVVFSVGSSNLLTIYISIKSFTVFENFELDTTLYSLIVNKYIEENKVEVQFKDFSNTVLSKCHLWIYNKLLPNKSY